MRCSLYETYKAGFLFSLATNTPIPSNNITPPFESNSNTPKPSDTAANRLSARFSMIDISETRDIGPPSPLWIPPYRRVSYRPVDTPIISAKKRLLPRLWDVVASTGPRRKLKGIKFWPELDTEAVDQWFPLDGEEGELVEDEGFLDVLDPLNLNPNPHSEAESSLAGPSAQTEYFPESRRFDIISYLPPEIALQVYLSLDLHALAAVAAVSRYWNTLSRDTQVWRELFYRQPHWAVSPGRAARQRLRMNSRASRASSTFATPAALYHRWGRNSLLSLRSVWTSDTPPSDMPPFEAPPLTLALDWMNLYKNRLEIDRRWAHSEPRVNRLAGHTDK